MPEILAINILTLPLFVLWLHFVNNIYTPFTAYYLVVRTNFLYAGTHFHADHPFFLLSDDTLLILYN
jgi:hypothetical protein